MTTMSHAAVLSMPPITSDDYVLDPRKSMPDYRREIYDLLQFLDEEQDKIEKQLARFSAPASSQRHPTRRRARREQDDGFSASEDEADDDFVVVEDVNAASRKKQLLSQLQQLWRTRDALRKRAKQLNIRIDSLVHGKGSGLMSLEDFSHDDTDFNGHDDHDEL
ncbi:hypothetical protein PSEUBRA_003002 [Kalmanozyma brasiliensis GHG001]|uniref:Uncharacterized protein n=1 Tax=Kalmanozyma brasiliensis (strain GHG001) TaxID=1365824 RepID=V5EBS5_KALBG|nr:uncharacterized protein PSEUBRA_003002 [Kalmanozyma brasiliensis GHG001]EST07881.1 hypothetical protein PSEUBRA_003002 [Kalmanozyma brasiliensis GHG001]